MLPAYLKIIIIMSRHSIEWWVSEQVEHLGSAGQKVKVKVVRVNLEERKIDFELIDKESKQSQTARARVLDKTTNDRSKSLKIENLVTKS